MEITRTVNHLAWNKSASQQALPGDMFLHRGKKKRKGSKRSSFELQTLGVHHWQKHNPRMHGHFSVLTGKHFVSESYSHFTLTLTALSSRRLFMIHSTMKTEFSPWCFTGEIQYWQKHSCFESWWSVHLCLQFWVMILLPFRLCNLWRLSLFHVSYHISIWIRINNHCLKPIYHSPCVFPRTDCYNSSSPTSSFYMPSSYNVDLLSHMLAPPLFLS